MARSVIPNPLERRHVLEGKLDAARALKIAEAYLAENRVLESIAFLRIAGATDRLDARQSAIETGDPFLLREVARAQERAIVPAEWAGFAGAAAAASNSTKTTPDVGSGGWRPEVMALRCRVFRGLVKEVEERSTSSSPPRRSNSYVTQSETGNHITITIIFDEPPLV